MYKTDVFLLLYVDDMLIASKDKHEISKLKRQLHSKFEMKQLGNARRILGIDILRDRSKGELRMVQKDYIMKILAKFNMQQSKEVCIPMPQHVKLSKSQRPKNEIERAEMRKIPYANAIGSIMYLMVCTRPDLAYSISIASRYMADPGRDHWEALKYILRYIKGAKEYDIIFKRSKEPPDYPLFGFVDSDFASSQDTRKSQTAYIFTLYGAAISWKSMLQFVVALSTTEAEYMAMTEAVKESIWLRGIIKDFGVTQEVVKVMCDNQSALHLAKHQVFHDRSKHIDVRFHFVRDMVKKGNLMLCKIPTEENAADVLTKPLPSSKFRYCLKLVGVHEI